VTSSNQPNSCFNPAPPAPDPVLVQGQSCPFDTITPKKAALRAEIFNAEVMESLLEPDDDPDGLGLSDDDYALAFVSKHHNNRRGVGGIGSSGGVVGHH
jgi:hypothetical protein